MDTSTAALKGSVPKRKLSRRPTPHPSFYLPSGFGIGSYIPVENAHQSRHNAAQVFSDEQFDFRRYLEECCLPMFTYVGKELFVDHKANIQREKSNRWPSMTSLYRMETSRGLNVVKKYPILFDTDNLYSRFEVEIVSFENVYSRSNIDPYSLFTLPYPDLKGSYAYKEEDLIFLGDIQNDTEMLGVLGRYVFRTAAYAASVLHRSDKNDEHAENRFELKIYNSLCKEPFRKWNIFALPSVDETDALPLIVVVMHPDDFGTKDFDNFVADGAFDPETLDCPTEPAEIVWALLYDTLKGRGSKFVVTTYLQWTFGFFDEDYAIGHVTEVVQADLTYLNGECWGYDSMKRNVMEMLVSCMVY